MLAAALAFIGGWRTMIVGGVIASLIFGGYMFVREYDRRGNELVLLGKKLEASTHKILVLEANEGLNKMTVKELDGRLAQLTQDMERTCELYVAAKDTEDPVGSVLEALKKGERK